ncbi:MAG: hypothetical protein Q9167_001179 [Letrouitia subvulpina]
MDTQGRSFDNLAAFLQSWLFFGLLETVLGEKIPSSEFTRLVDDDKSPRLVISTERLAVYLDGSKLTLTNLPSDEMLQRQVIIYDALSEAMIVNYRLNRKIFFGDPYPNSDLLQETLFCQTLLLLALERFMAKIMKDIDWTWFEAPHFQPLLEKRMVKAGWCPFDVQFLRLTFAPDVIAFIFSLGCTNTLKDHSLCQERYSKIGDHCVADSIGTQTLPKHVAPDCDCPLIGPDMDEIGTAIKNGKLPAVALSWPQDDPEDVDLSLWGEDLTDNKLDVGRYFAISHVWKQGLGNPNANVLPKCQVRCIAAILVELEASQQGKSIIIAGSESLEHRLTVPVWIDTFCIPVCPEMSELRNICIARMRKIYESATAVIALDPDLQQLSSKARPSEFLGHFLSCSWRSRLWTYQEGNLTWALLVPAQGKIFDVEKIFDPYPEFSDPNLDVTDGTVRGFLEAALTRSMIDAGRRLVRSSSVSIEVARDPEAALKNMLRALAHRTTSRDGDETICIATFMGLDPTPLLAEPTGDRMRKLICSLPVLSKSFLFAFGPRLQDPGFRWAPETFLYPHGYRRDIEFPLLYKPDRSDIAEPMEIPRPYICSKGLGMVAIFSGTKLVPQASKPLPEHFIVMTSKDKGFVVDVNDAGVNSYSWSEVCGNPTKEWAILFANEKRIRDTLDALLVEWFGEMEDGKIRCKWAYNVVAQELEDCVLEGFRQEILRQAMYNGRSIPFCEWVID